MGEADRQRESGIERKMIFRGTKELQKLSILCAVRTQSSSHCLKIKNGKLKRWGWESQRGQSQRAGNSRAPTLPAACTPMREDAEHT